MNSNRGTDGPGPAKPLWVHALVLALALVAGGASYLLVEFRDRSSPLRWAWALRQSRKPWLGGARLYGPEAAKRSALIYRQAYLEIIEAQETTRKKAEQLLALGPLAEPDTDDGRWARSRMNKVWDRSTADHVIADLESRHDPNLVAGNLISLLMSILERAREEEYNFQAQAERTKERLASLRWGAGRGSRATEELASVKRAYELEKANVKLQRTVKVIALEAATRTGNL